MLVICQTPTWSFARHRIAPAAPQSVSGSYNRDHPLSDVSSNSLYCKSDSVHRESKTCQQQSCNLVGSMASEKPCLAITSPVRRMVELIAQVSYALPKLLHSSICERFLTYDQGRKSSGMTDRRRGGSRVGYSSHPRSACQSKWRRECRRRASRRSSCLDRYLEWTTFCR